MVRGTRPAENATPADASELSDVSSETLTRKYDMAPSQEALHDGQPHSEVHTREGNQGRAENIQAGGTDGASGRHQVERVNWRPTALALGIATMFLLVEVAGGVLTRSLALLADAGHVATDATALGLLLLAMWLARRPATPQRSFGYYRAKILAASLKAESLVVTSFFVL